MAAHGSVLGVGDPLVVYCCLMTDTGLLIEEFAMLEASYAIVRLLQTFKNIELAEDETDDERDYPKHTVTLVVASANGCKVRMVV